MILAASPGSPSYASLAVAMVLGVLALHWLLPKPKGRSVALGTFAGLACGIVLVVWFANRFGFAGPDQVGTALFSLFSGGAVVFATIFVTQRNPARGAIAFAFVIVSVCGLFLLLAAPFLMAATLIIYAGAIIVTFLFVLMLSQTRMASDENDRTREPLLGSLAAFAFLGLVLFALYTSSPAAVAESPREYPLPAPAITPAERAILWDASRKLAEAAAGNDRDSILKPLENLGPQIAAAVGGKSAPATTRPIGDRLALTSDHRAAAVRQLAETVQITAERTLNEAETSLLVAKVDPAVMARTKANLSKLANDTALLSAHGELPARNVANLGYLLFTDYLLGVEMAGAALLIATIGAVMIASRRPSAEVVA